MFKQLVAHTSLKSGVSLPFVLFLLTLSAFSCQYESAPNHPSLVFDFDLDGVVDTDDIDDDNDGLPDELEGTIDLDGDKVPNYHDRDSDGDGINDLIEALGVDKDGDGTVDPWDEWIDGNKNGFHDEYEAESLVVVTMEGDEKQWHSQKEFPGISLDIDHDQIPNFWDLDSDEDGLSDFQEWALTKQPKRMIDTNADGFNDDLVGHIYTQGDKEQRSGHPEPEKEEFGIYQSIYADKLFGASKRTPAIDINENGIPNFFDKQNN